MKTWERRFFNTSAAVVVLTGFVYLWMKYVMATDDPFALVNHPWQPVMLAGHVLASPLFLLAFGIVLNSHVMKKLRVKGMANRRTGWVSLVTSAAMVGSGYLLQTVTDESLLRVLVIVHVVSGTAFAAAYTAHLLNSWRIFRRQKRAGTLAHVA